MDHSKLLHGARLDGSKFVQRLVGEHDVRRIALFVGKPFAKLPQSFKERPFCSLRLLRRHLSCMDHGYLVSLFLQ